MKRLAAYLIAGIIAVSLTSCSIAIANPDASDDGSASSSSQAAPGTDEPIDLASDNPLGGVEIASMTVCLYGVGEVDLTEIDAQTIRGIIQSDSRVFDDYYEGVSDGAMDNGIYYVGLPTYAVNLANGEELIIKASSGNDLADPSLYIGDYRYELNAEEFESFEALFKDYCAAITQTAEAKLSPYAGLTADDLESVTRLNYSFMGLDEEELDSDQLTLLLEALNELEIEPATADFNLPITMGGSNYYFRLTFKDGQQYDIGASSTYLAYDEDGRLNGDPYPVVFIDKTIYRCNKDAASDIYWTFEEMDPIFSESFLYGRDLPDYRFENLKASQIQSIGVLTDYNGRRVALAVPLDIRDEAAEMLRSLLLSDENRLEREGVLSLADAENATQLSFSLSTAESISMGVDGDTVYFNYWYYKEDPDVIAKVEEFIDLARSEADELLAINGDTQEVKLVSETVSNTVRDGQPVEEHSFFAFELPAELTAHNDGFYAEGYTLDNAPFAIQVMIYDTEMSIDTTTGIIDFLAPDSALSKQFEEQKKEDGGEGYTTERTGIGGIAFIVDEHVDEANGLHEWMFVSDTSYFVLEIHVIDRGGSDLTIDGLRALLHASLYKGNE